jgi:DNA-binding MarR family transcriptional regulator
VKTSLPRDHVDEVLAQWAAERPDLDTSPVAVVARIGRAARYLDAGVEAALRAHGLTRESFDVLATLRRSGPPYRLSPTALYRSLMRTSGAITHRVGILERAGVVRRVPDPADGRGLLVELTAAGQRAVDGVVERHLANERRLLAPLDDAQQEALAGLLRILLAAYEHDAGAILPVRSRRRRRPA